MTRELDELYPGLCGCDDLFLEQENQDIKEALCEVFEQPTRENVESLQLLVEGQTLKISTNDQTFFITAVVIDGDLMDNNKISDSIWRINTDDDKITNLKISCQLKKDGNDKWHKCSFDLSKFKCENIEIVSLTEQICLNCRTA